MADASLRRLERRFLETGAASDERAYLLARTRSGEELDWPAYWRLGDLEDEVDGPNLYALEVIERLAREGAPKFKGAVLARESGEVLAAVAYPPSVRLRGLLRSTSHQPRQRPLRSD